MPKQTGFTFPSIMVNLYRLQLRPEQTGRSPTD